MDSQNPSSENMLICKARMEEERTGIVTTINYTFKDDYGGEGNYPKTCPVTHQDMFQVKNKSGIDGDSGGCCLE